MVMFSSKKTNQLLYSSLNKLFKSSKILHHVPVKIGDNIYVSNYMICKEEKDWSIWDVETEKCIGVCLSKDGAIAYTRNEISKSPNRQRIKDLDADLAKAENDMIFYKHALKSQDSEQQSSTISRIEQSKAIIDASKKQLRDIIFYNDK